MRYRRSLIGMLVSDNQVPSLVKNDRGLIVMKTLGGARDAS